MKIVLTKRSWNLLFLILIAIVFFVGIYLLNYYHPIYNEDWLYTFVFGEKANFLNISKDAHRVNGVKDILVSQYNHYYEWGGRNLLHFIVQYLLYVGKFWSNLLNTFAYLIFIFTIYYIANFQRKVKPFLLLLIIVSTWMLIPSFIQNFIWITGSVNYLWGFLFVILFMHPYCTYYLDNKDAQNSALRTFLFIFFGIAAGWTNENIAIGLVFFVAMLLLLLKYEKRQIPYWMISGFIGAIIGTVIMLTAPGNYVRNALEMSYIHGLDASTIHYTFYLYRMIFVVKTYLSMGLTLTVIYIVMVLFFLWKEDRTKKTSVLRLSLLFFFTSVVSTVVMVAAPSFPSRVWFGILMFMIVASMLLYANIELKNKYLIFTNNTLCILLFGYCLLSYQLTLKDMIVFKSVFDKREAIVNEGKRTGKEDFIFEELFQQTPSTIINKPYISDMSYELKIWTDMYALYLGADSVKIEPKIILPATRDVRVNN